MLKKLMVVVFGVLFVANGAFADVKFPQLIALERINQQLSAPAPDLLPTTPQHFGPNIAGLVSWCKADMAMEYAHRFDCASGVSKEPMYMTLDRVVKGERLFKSDISTALKLYKSKDAVALREHLMKMNVKAKGQQYPVVFDNVMNQLYGADLNDAVHPYRMMLNDLGNDYDRLTKYIKEAKRDEYNKIMEVWENF